MHSQARAQGCTVHQDCSPLVILHWEPKGFPKVLLQLHFPSARLAFLSYLYSHAVLIIVVAENFQEVP